MTTQGAPVPSPLATSPEGAPLLPFPAALLCGAFEKRYKRFFVDMHVPGQGSLTVHCANSGSMKSCLLEGAPAWALDSGNPERKLRHSLELLELEDGLACLNTARANMLVERFLTSPSAREALPPPDRALFASDFPSAYALKREAKYNAGTRFDFLAEFASGPMWIEVKSVSLRLAERVWAFPDAVTERGQKHLDELMEAKAAGQGAMLVFVMMRGASIPAETLAAGFRPAHEIDPRYAKLLSEAVDAGVAVRLLVPSITPSGFGVRGWYPYPSRLGPAGLGLPESSAEETQSGRDHEEHDSPEQLRISRALHRE